MAGILSGVAGGAVVAITIRGVDDFSKTFRNAENGISKFSSAAKIGLGVATVALGAATAAVVNFGRASVQEAIEAEAAQNRLTTIVTNLNKQTDSRVALLQKERDAIIASDAAQSNLAKGLIVESTGKLKAIDAEFVQAVP